MSETLSVDHLVYAVPDLDRGTEAVSQLLGVTPTLGGSHKGFGTANMLIALGSRCYLEIIGPDPAQKTHTGGRPFGVDLVDDQKLVTWAVREAKLEDRVVSARAAGYDAGSIIAMSRSRPDGSRLSWRLAIAESALAGGLLPGDGLVPFLIDWGDSPHPAGQMPQECSLVSLRAEHPEPRFLEPLLEALNVRLDVTLGPSEQLIAVIDSPQGRVELR